MPARRFGQSGGSQSGAKYVDGYRLLQSFTTGGTAQGLQTTVITPSALVALTGVMALGDGDGASFIFARSASATSLSAWVTGFEPILGVDGQPIYYVERPLSSTAAVTLTTGVLVTTVTLTSATLGICATTAPALTTIPTDGLWVSSSGAMTGQMANFSKEDAGTTSGVLRWNFGGIGLGGSNTAQMTAGGVTHVRVLLSCATASQSIFCLAKRTQGMSRRA